MKTFRMYLEEDVEETKKEILKLWGSNADIEDIIKVTKKSRNYIKNLLKKSGKRGWEEL